MEPQIITRAEREAKKLAAQEVAVKNALPSNWQMLKNLVQAGIDVIKGGADRRTQEEIEAVLKICEACPFFIANEWGGRCGRCGCRLGTGRDGSLRFGKLTMRAWHCPIGKW